MSNLLKYRLGFDTGRPLCELLPHFEEAARTKVLANYLRQRIRESLESGQERYFRPQGFLLYEDEGLEMFVCGPRLHFYSDFFKHLKTSLADEIYLNIGSVDLNLTMFKPYGQDASERRLDRYQTISMMPGQGCFVPRGFVIRWESASGLFLKTLEKDRSPSMEYYRSETLDFIGSVPLDRGLLSSYYALQVMDAFPDPDHVPFLKALYNKGPRSLQSLALKTLHAHMHLANVKQGGQA